MLMAGQSPASHQAAKPRREDIVVEGQIKNLTDYGALYRALHCEVQ